MHDNGYIKIPRSLLSDPLWKSLSFHHQYIFLLILSNVCYKPQKYNDHGQIIDLEPGQICTTYRDLVKLADSKISKNDIERSIKQFILCGFLRQEVRHTKSILSICHKDTLDLILGKDETENETRMRQDRDKIETEKNKDKKDISNDISINIADSDGVAQSASPLRQEIFFNFESRNFENISNNDLNQWKNLYPAVNIDQELMRMSEWCISNQTNARSKKLWRKFINNWLSRANETILNKQAYSARQSMANTDRRTKNLDGSPVKSHISGLF